MSLTVNWKILVNKFHSKLSSYKAILLSFGGRLTLIKAVLMSLGSQGSKRLWRWRLYSNPDSLWVKVIRALHGSEGGFDHNGCDSMVYGLGLSGLLITYIQVPSSLWIPFAFRSYSQWSMVLKLVSKPPCWVPAHRPPPSPRSQSVLGVRNSAHLNNILLEISQIEVGEDNDKCVWFLAHDGVFSVGDLCRRIDDHILPSVDTKMTWDKSLPRKVNIFMWRLKLDRLSHRLHLSSRGIDIPKISCPSCSGNVETNHHIFFDCVIAKEVWKIIWRWCDEAFPLVDSNAHWIDWLDS
ncbi:RNA-directed DNA polymerase, eukaryota [Tanacetum coccineum]